jgi:hypothetical protein
LPLLWVQRLAALTPAVRDSRGETVARVGNKSSFEVGDRGEHVENALADGGRGINLLQTRPQITSAKRLPKIDLC